MFIKANNKIINVENIATIDCLLSKEAVEIKINLIWGDDQVIAYGQQAIDIIMQLCPSMLEGHRVKFIKHAWAIHNLIGHPGLQILSWIGLHRLGFKLHDGTVPRPKTIK